MTLKSLQDRITIKCKDGYGYKFNVVYRRKDYTVWVPVSPVTDAIRFDETSGGTTVKQAYEFVYRYFKKQCL